MTLVKEHNNISRAGNIMPYLKVANPEALGKAIRAARRALGITQPDLALTAGVGVRFLVDVEGGKATAQIGKIMRVLATLGIGVALDMPAGSEKQHGGS